MRDQLRDLNYFNHFIEEEEQRIVRFNRKLEAGEVKQNRIFSVNFKVHSIKLNIMIAKYSRGDCIEDLLPEYVDLAQEWVKVFRSDDYNYALWMVSLAVLLNVEGAIKSKYLNMLHNADVHDWLLDYLLTGIASNGEDLLWPNEYGYLKRIIEEKSVNHDSIFQYLKNWYQNNADCGWYDTHKCKEALYAGYWSFEIGAVAKLMHADDCQLTKAKYYPYDLVHFNGSISYGETQVGKTVLENI